VKRLITTLTLALALAACGGAAPAAQPAQGSASGAAASGKPTTMDQLAKYNGADRQQILEDGARKEGALQVYTSSVPTTIQPVVDGFTAKYPFIKVDVYRADNEQILQRITQEAQANKDAMDVLETTTDSLGALIKANLLQSYSSPEMSAYPKDSLQPDGYWGLVRESYVGLGYNTNLVIADQAPKTRDDLLDPKWKGKMTIAGSSTGVRFVGAILITKGEDFLKKLGQQQIRVQDMSGRALADLVVAGEVPLSPTIFDSHVMDSKSKGAPIEWNPLEPTVVNSGAVAVAHKAPHPNASLLFADFALSEAGQQIYIAHGYSSPRTGLSKTTFKKLYLESAVKDYETEYNKWSQLLRSSFS
jgi:iron(III) transport system substrate-binding protein